MFKWALLCLTFHFSTVDSTSIIVNMMDSSKSHISSILPLMKRVQKHGHNVHFMETGLSSVHYPYPPNITNTYFQLPFDYSESTFHWDIWRNQYDSRDNVDVWKVGDRAIDYLYHNNHKKFFNIYNSSWDLVVGDELFTVSSHALALYQKKNHGTPFIITSTCVMLNMMRYHLSLGGTLIHRPSKFIRNGEEFSIETFYARLTAAFQEIVDFYLMDKVANYDAVQSFPLLGIYDFHISQLAQQSSYYMTEELNSLLWPAPVSNQLLHVGFFCSRPSALPRKYRDFVEDPTSKGTILIAFGNHADWDHAPLQTIKEVIKGFNLLRDYRVIFTFKGNYSKVCDLGDHVMITEWAPQKELIAHNRTKVFISHGGLKSLQESICGAVPILIVPLFAEQPHNAEFACQTGIGDLLLKTNITAGILAEKIRNLAENSKYKQAAFRLREFYLDRPISSEDLAAFAVRRAIKMAIRDPVFKIRGMFISLADYFHVHVIFVSLALIIVQL